MDELKEVIILYRPSVVRDVFYRNTIYRFVTKSAACLGPPLYLLSILAAHIIVSRRDRRSLSKACAIGHLYAHMYVPEPLYHQTMTYDTLHASMQNSRLIKHLRHSLLCQFHT